MKKNIPLRPIKKPTKVSLFVSNPNVGAIDTETYTDYDGVNKIYALGFRTNLNPKPVIYYIDKDNLDSRKIILDILKNKGEIFYSDTDSIITNIELDNSMISPNELGKLKLEHKIDKGIFISGKTYWLSNDNGEVINRAKGIKSSSISYFDYVNLLNDSNIDTAIKTESKINWDIGHVTIGDKMVNINSDSYTKRLKVKVDGKWVDTRPLVINNINKSIIIYKNNFNLITYSDPKNAYLILRITTLTIIKCFG